MLELLERRAWSAADRGNTFARPPPHAVGARGARTQDPVLGEDAPDGPRPMAAWQRFYLGFKERFVDDCCTTLPNGVTVCVTQAPSAKRSAAATGAAAAAGRSRGGAPATATTDRGADPALTGTTVWDGAIVLSQFLCQPGVLQQHLQQHLQQQQQQQAERLRRPVVCLELGAGTALVSLCLLAAGVVGTALITDVGDMLPHIAANVRHNAGVLPSGALALPRRLRWGEQEDVAALAPHAPPFDVIVGSDLVYYSYTRATPHSRLLYLALQQLAGPATLIYLALSLHHNPDEVRAFLGWAGVWGFDVQELNPELPREYRVPDVVVVRLQLTDPAKAATAAAAAKAGRLERPDGAGG